MQSHTSSPYVLAATSKSKSVVELLIKKGADVNMTNKEGATVLHKATEINNLDVINILLRHGAKVRIQIYRIFDIRMTTIMVNDIRFCNAWKCVQGLECLNVDALIHLNFLITLESRTVPPEHSQ